MLSLKKAVIQNAHIDNELNKWVWACFEDKVWVFGVVPDVAAAFLQICCNQPIYTAATEASSNPIEHNSNSASMEQQSSSSAAAEQQLSINGATSMEQQSNSSGAAE